MATTTRKRNIVKNTPATESVEKLESVKEVSVVEPVKEVKETVNKQATKSTTPAKTIRQFNQTDPILCRSVTAGWLGVSGKSGQYYVFTDYGDECEIEYQDLFALKSKHSNYIYAPHFVIEDEELLENPRWADVAQFYDTEVYTMDDVDQILNLPANNFEAALKKLPKGLAKSLQVRVAQKIEDGTFDSLKKIKIIDDTYGTDFRSILAE